MRKMITRIKQGLANIKWLRDYRHYKVYKRQFKKIFQTNTLYHINKDAEKQYINKWKAVSKFVSPYDFRVYSQYIGEDPNIVPENVLHDVIEPVFLPKAYKQFYNDKNMYDKLLPKSFLAESLFRCIDGICCDGDYNVYHDIDDQQLMRLCCRYDRIIIKPTHDTGNGSRILLYQKKNGTFHPLGHEQTFSINSLIEYFNGNFVIQECLIQSSFTAQFNPTSVNTFRVFTYKSVKTNEVHVLGIVFRMGKENSFVDNSHAGGRYIGVLHNGRFANSCVFDQNGNKFSMFNGVDFSNAKFVVPNFQTVMDFSEAVAEKIFHNRTLDLDVMIDSDGNPKLIEYNVDGCSPWFYQFTTGPVYGEFTDEVIEYVKNHMEAVY